MSEETNKPIHEVRIGLIKGSVWKNHVKTDKLEFDKLTMSISKSYKDKDGEWKESKSFDKNEIPQLKLVADKCYEYILLGSKEE